MTQCDGTSTRLLTPFSVSDDTLCCLSCSTSRVVLVWLILGSPSPHCPYSDFLRLGNESCPKIGHLFAFVSTLVAQFFFFHLPFQMLSAFRALSETSLPFMYTDLIIITYLSRSNLYRILRQFLHKSIHSFWFSCIALWKKITTLNKNFGQCMYLRKC